jgi:hypothetical protein
VRSPTRARASAPWTDVRLSRSARARAHRARVHSALPGGAVLRHRDAADAIRTASEVETDDDPTERIALQKCPHCGEVTAVPLSLARTHCEVCGEGIAVCPLHA